MKKLGFGLMRLPLTDENNSGSIDYDLVNKMVDRYMEQGFTYFDTAWMYCGGKSEEAARECIVKRHPRDSFTLTTKMPSYMIKSFDSRDQVFNTQLTRTGAGYFDYYWLHDVNSQSIKTFDKFDCWNYILAKKEAGLVKHVGFSYHDGPELLDEVLTKHPEMEYVQLQINYLDWKSLAVQSEKCYDVCVKHHKPVIVMEPVKGGTLVNLPQEAVELFHSMNPDMSLASWAIRFVASLDNVYKVLSGMSTYQQLEDNTGYMVDFKPLTEEEKAACLKVADIINSQIRIPCTGCSYCTVNCPKNICIPKYFACYNTDLIEKSRTNHGWTPQSEYYVDLTKQFGAPADCIRCGQCEKMCPQHLTIRDYLQEVREYFEKK